MVKVISAEDAAGLINDGNTVALTSFGLACVNEETLIALEERFVRDGSPQNLTVMHASACGARGKRVGLSHLAHEGLVKRWIGGIMSASPAFAELISADQVEAYNWPQGVITSIYREIAAARPGVITKVGLGTFVDPRQEGAKVSPRTTEELIKLIELDGEEYLFFKSFPIDVGLIRGSIADEHGNLTLTHEGLKMEVLPLAQAVHNSGGIVIAQVEHVAKAGTLDPNDVKVPGLLIDYLVVSQPENHFQTENTQYNPAFSGQIKVPVSQFKHIALGERKVIARRAAAEVAAGMVVNLGVGMPAEVGVILAEEDVADQVIMTTEAGAVGGIAAGDADFGHAYNPEALVDMHAQFDFYDGGGLDLSVLGLAQADRHGNINVSKFGGRVAGCGGFINITRTAKTLIFAGTFTAGGLKEHIVDGSLEIIEEGRVKKFVEQVEQITFSGAQAAKTGQTVLYVTERAVLQLIDGVMTLIEVAPGVDLQRDVLDQMEFEPAVSPHLAPMAGGLFLEEWGELAAHIGKAQR